MSITSEIELQLEFLRVNVEKPIVLVGHMGSGKTTISKALAKALGWGFVEADDHIVDEEGMSIPDIFEQHGEPHFRDVERRVTEKLLNYEAPRVVGIGGGAFIETQTRGVIKEKAVSVYLKATVEELFRRIGDDPNRPMLKSKETPLASLQHLDTIRGPFYEQADLTVLTQDEPEQETLNRVISALYSHANPS